MQYTLRSLLLKILLALQRLTADSTFSLLMLQHASNGDLRDYCYLLAIVLGVSQAETQFVSPYTDNGTTLSHDEFLEQGACGSEQMNMSGIPLTLGCQDYNLMEDKNNGAAQSQVSSASSANTEEGPCRHSDIFTPATIITPSDTSTDLKRKQCPHCFRTFSTVSNLGKHMRMDCKANHGKRGFPCGNPGCAKVLTRKEYRDIHQREKCLFRPYGASGA